ncbi:MAG: hypothetical protein KU38_10785 [Sulfurovum sp. FS08-3]|nr:MAG: hypothetical protein KU38_10785 [Sulfurovum sp. FS08-3]
MIKPLNILSLFGGAGGLDLGFHQAGFQTIWANEDGRQCCIAQFGVLYSHFNQTSVGDRERQRESSISKYLRI